GHTYLRVVVTLADGGTSVSCNPMTNAPTGFPVRDDTGAGLTPHRQLIYAQGAGWYWNESVPGGGIHGNWGIRLSIEPLPHGDAGSADTGASADAAVARDGGSIDVGPVDAARVVGGGGGGCSCLIATRGSSALASIGALLALALYSRRGLYSS